ncbi:MAG: DUF1254 domain-containing protein [Saprospiraceae bacterium]|nr:DUF1254 domain-containing protein [Saprospiraceae bacterium]
MFIGRATAQVQSGVFSPDSVASIAREAYLYGYPMVENYRVMYQSCQDRAYAKYAPMNRFFHEKNVATAEDTLFVAPNGDTPYSYAVLDLRNGPLVLTIPPFESDRYIGFPLYDLYTQIVFTFSQRTIGNQGGDFLIAPAGWKEKVPKGIRQTVYSETDLVYLLVRTQLRNPSDLNRVHELQSQYTIRSLQEYQGKKKIPQAAPLSQGPLPQETPQSEPSADFFNLMNYLLSFCHPHASEKALWARFKEIGIEPGKPFVVRDAAFEQAVFKGMRQAKQDMMQKLPTYTNSSELFGTREQLNNDYLARAIGAWVGIYANQVEEFMGLHGVATQADGQPLDGRNDYVITFKAGDLPPVDGFWSLTLYRLPSRFMYKNELNRNVINGAMLPDLRKNADGSTTILIQHASPGKDWENNWLPCPDGPFTMSFRTYLPGERIRNGTWKVPEIAITRKAIKP